MTKNDDGRVFPFSTHPDLEALLQRQRQQTEAPEKAAASITPWLLHREGERINDFRKAWRNAHEAAGLHERLLHDLRRSGVRRESVCLGL